MGITILQWNANSLSAHIHELKHFLDNISYLPEIICVQETFLSPLLDIHISGYSTLRRDGENGRGGVATFIRNDLTYSDFICFENVEGMSVSISTTSGALKLFNFYISPSVSFDERLFQEIFSSDNIFVCGDFNAKSSLWGSPKADSRGKSLENILRQSNTVVLNTGSPTRVFNTGASHIDLSFASPRFANKTSWEVLNLTCGSDHNIIKIDFDTFVNEENVSVPRWVFKKADWPRFAFLCDSYLSDLDFDGELETLNESITESVIKAAKETIPQTSGHPRKRYARFWNDACSEAVKERDKAKRALKIDSPDNEYIEYKRLKAVANKTIKKERRKSWRSFCSSLSHRSKLGSVWKVIRNLNNNNRNDSIPSLKCADELMKTNLEKANLFGQHFSKVSSTANYSEKFRSHKKKIEYENAHIFHPRKKSDSVLNLPFRMSEFKKALKK